MFVNLAQTSHYEEKRFSEKECTKHFIIIMIKGENIIKPNISSKPQRKKKNLFLLHSKEN